MAEKYNNKSEKKKTHDSGLEFRARIKEQAISDKINQKPIKTLAEQLIEKGIGFIREGEKLELPDGTTPTFISTKGKVIYGNNHPAIHLEIAGCLRPLGNINKSLGKILLDDHLLMLGLNGDKTGIYSVVEECSEAQMARIEELKQLGYDLFGIIETREDVREMYAQYAQDEIGK